MLNFFWNNVINPLPQKRNQHPSGNRTADHTRDIGGHAILEHMVIGIVLERDLIGDS